MMQPILHPKDLSALVKTAEVVIVDAGDSISYATQHLKGAVHVDLNTDLACVPPDAANGGRHPLPDTAHFSKVLSRLDIKPESHVVIYDNKRGANAAARFWWMLRAAGHEKVQVINGGLEAVVKAGFPLSDLAEIPSPSPYYIFNNWLLPTVAIDDVEAASQSGKVIIDVRDSKRFKGETETIDLIAGHIPGAINIPYITNLDEDGLFLSPETLKDKFISALGSIPSSEAIVHCGSGVTACHTILAMHYAGLPLPKLYVGSWSEWSRNNKTIASGV
jgi:thiosulfate/3-mercaptopyruvate sulfurtransferase